MGPAPTTLSPAASSLSASPPHPHSPPPTAKEHLEDHLEEGDHQKCEAGHPWGDFEGAQHHVVEEDVLLSRQGGLGLRYGLRVDPDMRPRSSLHMASPPKAS